MADPLMDGLDALRQRGMSFTVRNNRLRVHPKHAYKTLSNDERLFLKQNRSAIKDIVLRGLPPLAAPVAATIAATTDTTGSEHSEIPSTVPAADVVRELRAARARAERDAYIKTHDPETWRVLHFNDPDEIARRNHEATAAMNSPYQPPIHNW